MSRSRRRFTAEQKAEIVRRHLSGKEPVSKLAEEFSVQPSQIHTWVNQVLTQAEKVFQPTDKQTARQHAQAAAKLRWLEAKLANKNEVIAELMEENVKAKKDAGEL